MKTLWVSRMGFYRKAIAFSYALVCIFILQCVVLCLPTYAETWVMVAKSGMTLEQQYVDADSVASLGDTIQLNTYWGFLDQPDSIHYATTEYRCATEEYRDVVVDAERTGMAWKPIGGDKLNRAAMTYGCQHATKL